MFRTRIELKQIGVRDEAKRLDGIGRCGRQYCSASWLPELRPVNLGVAKDQRLSLNPSQISGACGRLMCCLRYEHEFYVQSRKRFPKEGKILVTARGEEKVVANDIFRERVTLRGVDGEVRTLRAGRAARGDARRRRCARARADACGRGGGAGRRDASPARPRERGRRDLDRRRRSTPSTRRDHLSGDRRGDRSRARRHDGVARALGRRRRDVVRSGGAAGAAAAATGPAARTARARPQDDGRRPAREISEQVLPHHRDRLRERRSAHRPRVREDRRRRDRALSAPARRRRALPHRHGRARAEGRADRGRAQAIAPQALVDEIAERFQAMWEQLGDLVRPVHPHHRRAAQGAACARSSSASSSATPTTSTRRRTRAGTASAASRSSRTPRSSTASACCIRRARSSGSRSATGSSGSASYTDFLRALLARAAGVPAAGEPAQRDARAARPGARGHLGQPVALLVGRFPSRCRSSTGETQTTYVWFDALPNYLTATGFPGAGCDASAGRRSCTSSARTSRASTRSSGRRCCRRRSLPLPRARLGARLRAARRRAVQQVGRRAARPRRGDRPLRRRRVPLLPAARGAVRRRRQLLVGAVRGALQRRPRERVGQPREPRRSRWSSGTATAIVPAGRAHRRSTRATRRTSRSTTRRWTARAATCCTRRCRRVWQTRRARQRVRRPAGAVEAREGSGAARRARDDARLARAAARASRGARSRRSCRTKAQELWAQLGAPRALVESALRTTLPTLDATGWQVQKGDSLFPKEKPAA